MVNQDTTTVISLDTVIEQGESPFIMISPNPTTGLIKADIVNFVENLTYDAVFKNSFGKVVFNQKVRTKSFNIDLSQNENGMYILHLSNTYGDLQIAIMLRKKSEPEIRNDNDGR